MAFLLVYNQPPRHSYSGDNKCCGLFRNSEFAASSQVLFMCANLTKISTRMARIMPEKKKKNVWSHHHTREGLRALTELLRDGRMACKVHYFSFQIKYTRRSCVALRFFLFAVAAVVMLRFISSSWLFADAQCPSCTCAALSYV